MTGRALTLLTAAAQALAGHRDPFHRTFMDTHHVTPDEVTELADHLAAATRLYLTALTARSEQVDGRVWVARRQYATLTDLQTAIARGNP